MSIGKKPFRRYHFSAAAFSVEFWDDTTAASEVWTSKTQQGETWTEKTKQAEAWTTLEIAD